MIHLCVNWVIEVCVCVVGGAEVIIFMTFSLEYKALYHTIIMCCVPQPLWTICQWTFEPHYLIHNALIHLSIAAAPLSTPNEIPALALPAFQKALHHYVHTILTKGKHDALVIIHLIFGPSMDSVSEWKILTSSHEHSQRVGPFHSQRPLSPSADDGDNDGGCTKQLRVCRARASRDVRVSTSHLLVSAQTSVCVWLPRYSSFSSAWVPLTQIPRKRLASCLTAREFGAEQRTCSGLDWPL